MDSRRVLIFSYYFPPMGGVEVQRVTRFVSHLSEYGWEPVVVTTKGGSHYSWDATLLAGLPKDLKVFRVGALEHYSTVGRMERLKQGPSSEEKFRSSRGTRDRLLRRLDAFDRRYLCFPDEKNWWACRALLPALRIVRKYRPEVIFATGFPWSTLAAAARLSRWTGVPLVADMRDAWTTDPRKWWASIQHQRLERQVFESASQIVCATEQMRIQFEKLYPGLAFRTINNACADPGEAVQEPAAGKKEKERVRFIYTGSLSLGHGKSPESRTPYFFLKALLELLKDGEVSSRQVAVDFYGIHPAGGYDLEDPQQELLNGVVTWHGSVARATALQAQNEADVLLLIQAKGFDFAVGGKFFEYLMTRKPILACVPDTSEVAQIIRKLSAGLVTNIEDVGGIKAALKRFIAQPRMERNDTELSQYTLSGAMQGLASVLEKASKGNPPDF